MIAPAHRRCVVGVMSGTSLDGIDVAIAKLEGHGRNLQITHCYGTTYSFSEELQHSLRQSAGQESFSVGELSQLHVRLAHEYADAVIFTLEEGGGSITDIDLIGCHGQTIRHLPNPTRFAGRKISSTLQIGDSATLAQLLGVPVIGDFRLADMACGGQGAPLVPYFDYVVFTHDKEARGCLNLGGVANLTILPPNAQADQVTGFDTGPGNIIIDALCRHCLGVPYDEGGHVAISGTVDETFLAELLQSPYLSENPPKSTGRDYLHHTFLQQFLDYSDWMSSEDMIATATAFTAASIWQAYARFVEPNCPLDCLIVSGGGVHNRAVMDFLKDYFAQSKTGTVRIEPSGAYGVDADSKEALCFAVLAHETANGIPTSLPSVTGAERPAVLGKLSVP